MRKILTLSSLILLISTILVPNSGSRQKQLQPIPVDFALAISIAPAGAIVHQYSEDFTTTAKKDAVNTTANWNTTAGRLELFPFTATLAARPTSFKQTKWCF